MKMKFCLFRYVDGKMNEYKFLEGFISEILSFFYYFNFLFYKTRKIKLLCIIKENQILSTYLRTQISNVIRTLYIFVLEIFLFTKARE